MEDNERMSANGEEVPSAAISDHEQTAADISETRSDSRRRRWYVQVIRFLFHLLWLPALSVACIVGGLIIGYTLIGGQPVEELFTRDLWQHLYDLVYLDN